MLISQVALAGQVTGCRSGLTLNIMAAMPVTIAMMSVISGTFTQITDTSNYTVCEYETAVQGSSSIAELDMAAPTHFLVFFQVLGHIRCDFLSKGMYNCGTRKSQGKQMCLPASSQLCQCCGTRWQCCGTRWEALALELHATVCSAHLWPLGVAAC